MARGKHGAAARRPVEVGSITNATEKDDLLALVTRIMDTMEQQIVDVFDSPPVTPTGDEIPCHTWVTLAVSKVHVDGDGAAREEENQSNENKVAEDDGSTTDADPPTFKVQDPENNIPPAPQLGELKKELFVIFKKWQGSVMQRLRDIRVQEPPVPAQAVDQGCAGRGRGARGGRGAARGGRGRSGGAGASAGARAVGPKPPATCPLRPHPFDETDPQLARRFKPHPTPLWQLPFEQKTRLLHITMLLILSLEEYNAYSRNMMLHLASSLHLPMKAYQENEVRVAQGLGKSAAEFDPAEALRVSDEMKAARRGRAPNPLPPVTRKIGSGVETAGIMMPLGGGPSGIATATGLLGPTAEVGVGIGGLFGIYMAKSSVKTMESYTKDVQEFGLIPMHGKVRTALKDAQEICPQDRRLRVVIASSGWLTEEDDIIKPWKCLGDQAEVYALRWEPIALTALGAALETVIRSTAWSVAKQEGKSRTIFENLKSGGWPLSLLKINKIIDNPWCVGLVRADKAGVMLADAIQRKVHGARSVSLIGYSLSARAIYTCLMTLAERRQFGLVDSVIMMGTPAPSESRVWLTMRSVVVGRLVNVYSEKDSMLGFLMRYSCTQFGIAGLQSVEGARGVENYDATSMVGGHLRYHYVVSTILKNIGWENLDADQVAKDKQILAELDAKYNTVNPTPHVADTIQGEAKDNPLAGNKEPRQGRGRSGKRGKKGSRGRAAKAGRANVRT